MVEYQDECPRCGQLMLFEVGMSCPRCKFTPLAPAKPSPSREHSSYSREYTCRLKHITVSSARHSRYHAPSTSSASLFPSLPPVGCGRTHC